MMRLSLIALGWMWAGFVTAHNFPLVDHNGPEALHVDLHSSYSTSKLQRRDLNTVQIATGYSSGQYLNISIGTPPQPLGVIIDIQDFGLDILTEDGKTHSVVSCDEDENCSLFGEYDPRKSSSNGTAETLLPSSSGNRYTPIDNVTIGAAQLEDIELHYFKLGQGHVSKIGLGPDNTSFAYIMADQGFIKSPSFSVWPNITKDGHGGLLFGGVNTAKYHGPLQAYSFKDGDGASIPLDRFQVQNGSITTKEPRNYTFASKSFMLDPLDTLTTLPNDTVQQMYKDYNISWIGFKGSDPEYGTIDCNRKYTENNTISLVFGDATISAPWSDFFVPWISPGVCLFHIQPLTADLRELEPYGGTIGNVFVQRMYIAINYNDNSVGVAAINQDPGPDRILEIDQTSKLPDSVELSSSFQTGGATTVATSTSMGLSAMQTIPVVYGSGALSGVAAVALLAMF